MELDRASKKTLLVLGGDSSMAQNLFSLALKSSYEIVATTRRKSNDPVGVNWLPLDLATQGSMDDFLSQISVQEFNRIIVLIGGVAQSHFKDLSYLEVQDYHRVFISNLLFVIQNVVSNLAEGGNLVAMSSRAAYAQSFDPYYAATKGALESFINSLSRHLKPAQSLVSVRAGLIRESRMFFEMPADVRLKHMEISGNSLIDLNLACEEIWKLDPKMTLKHNGEVVYVGPKY